MRLKVETKSNLCYGIDKNIPEDAMTAYAIWNNKGGVGKSTIAFHIANRHARENLNKTTLLIDLCPQANSSMMILGGGAKGENKVLDFCTEPTPRTVVGYLSSVIAGGERAPLPNPYDFIVKASDFNDKVPDNLYLLCGDGNLEPMAPAISNAANAPALTPRANPWRWVHEIFKKLINSISENSDTVVFIDTNPSFSIYTEIAVSSADKILVPVNADDSSRVATNAMFTLLHGATPPHPVYGSWTYAEKARTSGLVVPQVHLVIGNRLTQYVGAATAFQALSGATADTLYRNFTTHPTYFTSPATIINNIDDFKGVFSVSLRDFNTAGVVASHLGFQMTDMKQGYYPVHGTQVKVNAEQIGAANDAIKEIIDRL